MNSPKKKIPLESREEILEQYDHVVGEEIFSKEAQYAKAIGKFLIAFSNLESTLGLLIVEAIHDRSHEPGYQVIKYLNFRNKTNLARDQYGFWVRNIQNSKKRDRNAKALDFIVNKLEDLSDFRNKVAHANWMSLTGDGYVRVKIGDNGENVVFKRVKMTPQIMYKFTRQCHAIAQRIETFQENVNRDLFA